MPSFRILIADGHEIVRQGLRALIEPHPGWEVCDEDVDGWEAVQKAQQIKPDLLALDIGMPNFNGLDAARESQVIQFLTEGKDVAALLNLSVKTAETHRSDIMRKLGLHSVRESVL